MKKIQEFLIHLLGGCTMEECKESNFNCYSIGRYAALTVVMNEAKRLYGIPAEQWCEQMYDFINKKIEELRNK